MPVEEVAQLFEFHIIKLKFIQLQPKMTNCLKK